MKFTVPIQTARPLLMRPALFAAKDDSRPVLNTVHLEAYADGRIVAVAADGFIFGLQEATGEVEEDGSVNVPLDTINAAAKHWPNTGLGTVTVSVVEPQGGEGTAMLGRVTIACEATFMGTSVSGYAVNAKFPEYQKLIVQTPDPEWVTLNTRYMAVVERAARMDKMGTAWVSMRGNGKTNPATFYIAASEAVGEFVAMVMPIYQSDEKRSRADTFIARLTAKPKRTRKKS